MKIGLDSRPVRGAESYVFRLDELLPKYAPEHEYVVDGADRSEVDIYHSFRYALPNLLPSKRVPRVVTVHNLNFVSYPWLYPLAERMRFRFACRTADRVVALGDAVAAGLTEWLGIDPAKIEVVLPLVASPPPAAPAEAEMEAVRRKYDLPDKYLMCLEAVNPRTRYGDLFDTLVGADTDLSLVVCGRRTPWAAELLATVRENHLARRVEFIYEYEASDLQALLRMAHGFLRLHGGSAAEAVAPLVGAMRAGAPLVLADTPHHREVAGDAAYYIPAGDLPELAATLEGLGGDAGFRQELAGKGFRRAELYSEASVARRVAAVYSAL